MLNRKIMFTALALTLAFCGVLSAQERVEYRTALKSCGSDWRASDARKAVEKGKGREAWNKFRAECVVSKGYVKGARKASKSDTAKSQ